MEDMRDVFLCHASEDKEAVVGPLDTALRANEISSWVDEAEIAWGESFTKKIGEGLDSSRYVIAVISQSFIGKTWPEYELDAAFGMEASVGVGKVLPLLVGDQSELLAQVKDRYPFLRNRKFLFWKGDPQPVVEALRIRLGRPVREDNAIPIRNERNVERRTTYIPKLRKEISQRDRDRFLKRAFDAIRDYFQRAVEELKSHSEEIEADFIDIDNEKFRCRVYYRGELENECLIRIGGLTSRDSIGYTAGKRMLRENSFNEIIRIADDDSRLSLMFSLGSFPNSDRSQRYDPEEAAEALWRRFVSSLERR